jgi:hypothetical protein
MTVNVLDENDPIGKRAIEISQAVEGAVMSTLVDMKRKGDSQTPHHLYITVCAAAVAIQVAAKLMSMPEDKDAAHEWAEGKTSRTAMLVAALLVARCAVPAQDGMNFEYNTKNILAAMEAAEKITGHNNDREYTPKMVEAARKNVAPADFFDNNFSAETVDLSQFRTLN